MPLTKSYTSGATKPSDGYDYESLTDDLANADEFNQVVVEFLNQHAMA